MNGRRKLGKMPRKQNVSIVLKNRDRNIFRRLVKARVMRSADFAIFDDFPSIAIVNRRLRKLLDAKYLKCFVDQLHFHNRWVLDQAGYDELETYAQIPPSLRWIPNNTKNFGDHHFTAVRFWALLLQQCKQENIQLKRFVFEWELAPDHLNTITSYRPDMLFKIQKNNQEIGFVVEVDRGNESVPYIIKNKMEVFANYHATRTNIGEFTPHKLFFLCENEKKMNAIAKQCSVAAPIHLQVFGPHSTSLSLPSP